MTDIYLEKARNCGRITKAPDDPKFRFDNGLTKEQEIRRISRIDRQFDELARSFGLVRDVVTGELKDPQS